jgi:hypothetical protein
VVDGSRVMELTGLDTQRGGISGITALERVRTESMTPFIFVTGSDNSKIRQRPAPASGCLPAETEFRRSISSRCCKRNSRASRVSSDSTTKSTSLPVDVTNHPDTMDGCGRAS